MFINQESVKQHLVQQSQFLKAVATSNNDYNTKHLIKSASDEELNALGYVLAAIAQGLIPMKSVAHSSLKQKRKLAQFRQRFETSEDFEIFLNQTKYEKENNLVLFAHSLPSLLKPLVTSKHS